jgi:hypothetical protein
MQISLCASHEVVGWNQGRTKHSFFLYEVRAKSQELGVHENYDKELVRLCGGTLSWPTLR